MAGMGGARDLFAVEAMEPRILLSASPIDAPLSTTDVSVVPETQTAGDLMVQQSPATTSDIVLPVTLDTSHLYGETTDLPSTDGIDFAAPETTSFSNDLAAVAETSATSSPTTGTNDFVAHDDDKTTAPTEPVFDSVTTELVTTLRAANGPPADENSSTPVVNNFSNNSILCLSYGFPNALAKAIGEVSIFEGFVVNKALMSLFSFSNSDCISSFSAISLALSLN